MIVDAADTAIGIAGVMGGASTEISEHDRRGRPGTGVVGPGVDLDHLEAARTAIGGLCPVRKGRRPRDRRSRAARRFAQLLGRPGSDAPSRGGRGRRPNLPPRPSVTGAYRAGQRAPGHLSRPPPTIRALIEPIGFACSDAPDDGVMQVDGPVVAAGFRQRDRHRRRGGSAPWIRPPGFDGCPKSPLAGRAERPTAGPPTDSLPAVGARMHRDPSRCRSWLPETWSGAGCAPMPWPWPIRWWPRSRSCGRRCCPGWSRTLGYNAAHRNGQRPLFEIGRCFAAGRRRRRSPRMGRGRRWRLAAGMTPSRGARWRGICAESFGVADVAVRQRSDRRAAPRTIGSDHRGGPRHRRGGRDRSGGGGALRRDRTGRLRLAHRRRDTSRGTEGRTPGVAEDRPGVSADFTVPELGFRSGVPGGGLRRRRSRSRSTIADGGGPTARRPPRSSTCTGRTGPRAESVRWPTGCGCRPWIERSPMPRSPRSVAAVIAAVENAHGAAFTGNARC